MRRGMRGGGGRSLAGRLCWSRGGGRIDVFFGCRPEVSVLVIGWGIVLV